MTGDVLGNILGRRASKDKYSHNMAITPEKFKKKYDKFQSFKHPTGAKFMNIANELDDQQLAEINAAYAKQKEAHDVLQPYGLGIGTPRDAWVHWRTHDIAYDRKEGRRKEKNPRQ